MARQAQSTQNGQDFQQQLLSLKTKGLSPEEKEKKLRAACEGFESIFIQKMWKEMRNTVHQSTLLHGKEEQFWQDMYDQELAKKMTSAGGIGLANMMYEQLSSHLTSASKSTANTLSPERHFVPSAAPLLAKPVQSFEIDKPLQQANFYEQGPSEGPIHAETNQPKMEGGKRDVPVRDRIYETDPTVTNALQAMRSNVAAKSQMSPHLAQVNYSTIDDKPQPLNSTMSMQNAVRRQASDQLGSRGVREPLLPQTKSAREATLNADARRESRRVNQHERRNMRQATQAEQLQAQAEQLQAQAQAKQLQAQPQPQFQAQAQQPQLQPHFQAQASLNHEPTPQNVAQAAPSPQALPTEPIEGAPDLTASPVIAAQSSAILERDLGPSVGPKGFRWPKQAASSEVPAANQYHKVTYTTNMVKAEPRKQQANKIRTLNLDSKAKVAAQPRAPEVQQRAPIVQAQTATAAPLAQPYGAPLAEAPRQNFDKQNNYNIPPLSVSDLRRQES
ncbi:MAG: rod-binding protein [Desulfovibrionaceae bacterium]|nr:rod-binding protein [Desulfovibrionaceae bacterium]